MHMIPFSFEATRAAGLARLAQFAPRTGHDYAAHRNADEGPGQRQNVSMLSPWLRFRLLTEEEVLAATLQRFNLGTSEKFVQEVFWRAYFKGYLETRPSIWTDYVQAVSQLEHTADCRRAIAGETGIDCFDAWVTELKQTGYLHNHARMWFASIWIFTLRLPWQLGADVMYRHLIDGDPASNTLSWRWVGGLHTRGKTYLARPDNIARYTNDRFQPKGLATVALPLDEAPPPAPAPLPPALGQWPEGRFSLLLTTEDLCLPQGVQLESVAIPIAPVAKPGGPESPLATAFKSEALNDAAQRAETAGLAVARIPALDPASVLKWCQHNRIAVVAVAYAPVGPEADALDAIEALLADHDITLLRIRRRYDTLTWPHSTRGFFALKDKIPVLLQKLHINSHQPELFA